MIDLDNRAALRRGDPSGMLEAVLALAGQCREGYRDGRDTPNLPSGDGVTSLVACGMGGSGVAGDIVAALYRERLGIPIAVVKGSVLPEFCGKDTLVVCSSYSGGTAETLACLEEAERRGCRILAVTSGGELAAAAEATGVAVTRIPEGVIAPRAAVGHLAFGTLGALEAIGVLPALADEVEHAATVLDDVVAGLEPDRPVPENPAKRLAARIGDRVPVIWGADGPGGVAATRWKTQMNENAKTPAFSSALPELDHNEVVGWAPGTGERFFLVTLRLDSEPEDVAARFPVSVQVAIDAGLEHEEVRAVGDSPLSELMSLVLLGDATSVYLGLMRGVDPTPIEAISRIKAALAEGPEG